MKKKKRKKIQLDFFYLEKVNKYLNEISKHFKIFDKHLNDIIIYYLKDLLYFDELLKIIKNFNYKNSLHWNIILSQYDFHIDFYEHYINIIDIIYLIIYKELPCYFIEKYADFFLTNLHVFLICHKLPPYLLKKVNKYMHKTKILINYNFDQL